MVVKNQIMQPFEDFDKVYKECVTDVYGPADEALKGKITDVEAGLKADKEKKVVAYFDELVKANGVEWVSYGEHRYCCYHDGEPEILEEQGQGIR